MDCPKCNNEMIKGNLFYSIDYDWYPVCWFSEDKKFPTRKDLSSVYAYKCKNCGHIEINEKLYFC